MNITRSFRSILGLFKADILGIAAKEEKEYDETRKEAINLAIVKAALEYSKREKQKELDELEDKQIREKYGKMTPEERKAADDAEIERMGF